MNQHAGHDAGEIDDAGQYVEDPGQAEGLAGRNPRFGSTQTGTGRKPFHEVVF